MESKCGKCDSEIANSKDGFKCVECNSSFHVSCSTEASKKTGTRNKTSWKCDGCVAESSSAGSRTGDDRDNGQSAVLKALAAFRQEVNGKFSKLEKMQEDIHTVTEVIGQFREQLETTSNDVKETKAKIVTVEEENVRLNNLVVQLRSDVDDLEQHTRKNNMIVTGIPFTKNENLSNILERLATLIKVEFHWYDVSAVHRLQQREEGRSPAIVINFVSRKVKSEWMLARRSIGRLSAREMNERFPDTTIYFNEHLTVRNQAIFKKGRELVKQDKLAFVWVSDGRILAKKTRMGRTARIRSEEELEILAKVSTPPSPTSYADVTVGGANQTS